MRILLTEDDDVLRNAVAASLRSAGHKVDEASNLIDTRQLWRLQAYDAVLLDLNLPDGSGLSALKEARARNDKTPVIVLTARNRTEERIAGLDAGADDYLGKPFDLDEIEARLRALMRRAQDTQTTTALGALLLDRRVRRFSVHLQELQLPAREFEVLWELMSPPGRVVSKRELSNKLSDFDDALGDNALEAFISRLRKKLADIPDLNVTIRTVRGIGYLVEMQELTV
jgi:two-component system, OmpR family, response regulator